jgi:hypothetical protein
MNTQVTVRRLMPMMLATALFAVASAPAAAQPAPPPLPPYDAATGNGAIQVVIPAVLPTVFGFTSASGSDATLVLRVTTIITNAWFDASAPYHPTAIGVYSNLGRRPASEALDNSNINAALITASYRVMLSLYPLQATEWENMMISAGLDPDDDSEDLTTPTGLGNAAGRHIVEVREHDGMNQLGDEDRTFHRRPYSDYTGYAPVNTAYRLTDPSRWQPNITRGFNGITTVQSYVTPQMAITQPYSFASPEVFHVPPPVNSDWRRNKAGYKRQADEVLAASASLTDERKLTAELFNNKIESLGFSALFMGLSRGLSLLDFIHYDFVTNMAAFDTAIVVWQEKTAYDAVRPSSAIRFLYKDKTVSAWGGPGLGTVQMKGQEWAPYLNAPDHPEYPSGSSSFCGAHAEASRLFFGNDSLGWSVGYAAGSSRAEPGVTPAAPVTLTFPTWTNFEERCAQSRLDSGAHFKSALAPARAIGRDVADVAFDFFRAHVDGTIGDDGDDDGDGCHGHHHH